MSNPSPSPGSRPLDQLKVAELRDELRKRGLSLKGVKKDLFERLDEAVRNEQAGFVGEEEVHGGHSSGLPHDNSSVETTQDNDGMSYLNDAEDIQDTALIVNNASPYVGASDATPVFMEPRKDTEILNSIPVVMEERKDDASIASGSALLQSSNSNVNAGNDTAGNDKAMPQLDNVENSVPEAENQVVEIAIEAGNEGSGSETGFLDTGNQASGADATLAEIGSSQYSILASPSGQCGVSDVTAVNPGLDRLYDTVVTEPVDSTLPTPFGDDIVAGESAQELSGAEVATINDLIIPSEGDKDAPTASVSDDILNAADASVPAADIVVNANDIPMQDVEVFERTVLTSVSVVPCVQESGKEPDDGAPKILSFKEEILEEDTKKGGLQEGGEAVEAIAEVQELPMLEAGHESRLQESDNIVAQELAQDSVVQAVPQDIEMAEAREMTPAKIEASETKPLTAVLEALELSLEIKSENVDNIGVSNTGNFKEASSVAGIDERTINVKSEPREAESRVSRRAAPMENVKVEQQEIKEEPPKSGRSFDRVRPRDYDSDRSRHNSARAFDERGRVESRSGRYFKEEGRKDTRETASKLDEGSDMRTSQKRKEDDRDAKVQEPAKRVRRWNSGNQPVVEIAKPLTSGTVNEIVSPEVKREDSAVSPPKLTPKLSGPVKPMPPATKAGFEANGDERSVPPSTRPPSASLKVERFVRPFTLKAVKDLLAEFGECVDFWMDQIKTHCYVTYSKVDAAIAARNGLYDRQWPPPFGNLLVADFVDSSEVKMRSDGSYEKMNAPASTTPRAFQNQAPALGAQPSGHSSGLAFAPPLRERQLMQVPIKDPEPPVPTLDDLFRKTKTKPHIYYLPLSDEQVTEKLAAFKNKEQHPARGRPIGRV